MSAIAIAFMIWATALVFTIMKTLRSWLVTALKLYADRTAAIRERGS